jgi:hypothetical protein
MKASVRTRRWATFASAAVASTLVAGVIGMVPSVAVSAAGRAVAASLTQARVPTYGVYLGADPNSSSGVNTVDQAMLLDKEIGRSLGIVSFYTPFATMPPVAQLRAVSAKGSIPMVSMHCGPADSVVAAGKYDSQLRSLANSYKAYGRPVLLRWFWEMNLPTSGQHSQCLGPVSSTWSSGYVAAYRHIWAVFRAAGASNVSFVWCPSDAHGTRGNANVNEFFPGTAYVDWIGADLYDKPIPHQQTFETQFGAFYRYWADPAHGAGRPIMICETGAVSTGQVSWLGGIASAFELAFPQVHAIVYGDAKAGYDYRLVPGSAGMKEFVSIAHSVYFTPFGPDSGFVSATSAGAIFPYSAPNFGSMKGKHLPSPIVGIAADRAGAGYWLVSANGSVYTFGHAHFFGSMGGKHLNKPIVGMAALPNGGGYWLVASDGGVFSFGAARFHGSMGGKHLNKPIVGMASSPTGHGYWFVASDGGIFTYGDARFFGSTGSLHLHRPIDGMAAVLGGGGYWLVASDGGIFTFGDAHFLGSLGASHLSLVISGMATDPSGGYRMIARNGTVYQFPGEVVLPDPHAAPAVGIATA